MNVNFEYYKIFYYVAKYKNFTKAAHALNNSQPNVTRAMNCLEQELHCILFVRTNRGVYLTPEGRKTLCQSVCRHAAISTGGGRTVGRCRLGTWNNPHRCQ